MSVVGVLGGLGPLATIHFMEEVVEYTLARTDQEHVNMVVSQYSATPDRTNAIIGNGPSPAPIMCENAKMLENGGADFIVVPCNTASYFIDQVRENVSIPVLDIVEETVREVRSRLPRAKTVGVMATEGTQHSGVYQSAIEAAGLDVIPVSEDVQKAVSAMIYDGVKAGRPVDAETFYTIVEQIRFSGAEAIISGCTEISVVYHQLRVTDPAIVDSMDVLARQTVVRAGHKLRTGLTKSEF